MSGLKLIPTYRVIDKEEISKKKDRITLTNLANYFDVIRIKVPSYVGDMIFEGDEFSVNSRIRRTWYTLWLGKKEEYYVLGNVDKEGDVLLSVTSASLSNEGIEELQREWKKMVWFKITVL